jgi:UDP-2,3-diacylglucosamine hydrolase
VISDIHLGVASSETERRLLRYLEALPDSAASLVINGDLFDFWFEWRRVIPRCGYRVVAQLAQLRDRGIPVTWIAGNHDGWGADFLRDDVGVDYVDGAWSGRIGQWTTRIEHGDGLRPTADRWYRLLKRVIRHPLSIRAFRLLHPDLGSAMATGSSQASRTYIPSDEGRELREIALRALGADPSLDLLIYGHSHTAALVRENGGGVYANAGSWLDEPLALVVDDTLVSLMTVGEDGRTLAERDSLHLLDRRAEERLPQGKHLLGGVGGDKAVPGRRA